MIDGDPKFEASQRIPNVPHYKFAELIGSALMKVDPAETSIVANTARQVLADFFRSKT